MLDSITSVDGPYKQVSDDAKESGMREQLIDISTHIAALAITKHRAQEEIRRLGR